jgi:hypothetical protein
MLTDEAFHQGLISDIPMHKYMPDMRLDRLQICEITGIFQCVEIHHLMTALNNQSTYEMRPDKSGPTGYKDSHLRKILRFEIRGS